ncbi:hypothetical protein M422DRAFT_275928 [Sphaerobolus stellatus SS14]|uniref:Uncharacterized protein n=1 Tax=Sphaerobolus stellatus (strain SS14) TaxID=990650 RepID=A0A0C9UE84_SPHS4|nr:hypothetical protein M422DRAFT_275928 [Sphaerobolus stellatus SS14]
MQQNLDTVEAQFHQDQLKSPLLNVLQSPRKRVHVEEVPDEKDLIRLPFPQPAGSTYGQAQTMFDKLRHLQEVGQMGMMGPFNDKEEWEEQEVRLEAVGARRAGSV